MFSTIAQNTLDYHADIFFDTVDRQAADIVACPSGAAKSSMSTISSLAWFVQIMTLCLSNFLEALLQVQSDASEHIIKRPLYGFAIRNIIMKLEQQHPNCIK